MKISESINILEINDVPVKPYTAGYSPKDMLTIYSDKTGIRFWDEATIWFVSVDDDNKINNYTIKETLKKKFIHLNANVHKLEKYLAIFELLSAIAEYKGENIESVWRSLESSVEKLNNCVQLSLDFSEIRNMKNLIEVIKNDVLYKQVFFVACSVKCREADEYKGYKKDNVNYCFGNRKYHEKPDVVHIDVYNDVVKLCYKRDGKSYQRNLQTQKEYTDESKILEALDCWKCAIYN